MENQLFNGAWQQVVQSGGRELGVTLDKEALDMFAFHAAQLNIWNTKINLTSIDDPFEIAVKHFIDSLAVLPYIEKTARVMDIGAGGGFPSIPLKIALPSIDLMMVDSSRKKVSFLNDTVRQLGLENAVARHARVEELTGEGRFKSSFDVVISRAFSSLDNFLHCAWPFVAKGGSVIAMKGGKGGKEIDTVKTAGVDIHSFRYTLPVLAAERVIVKITRKDLPE